MRVSRRIAPLFAAAALFALPACGGGEEGAGEEIEESGEGEEEGEEGREEE